MSAARHISLFGLRYGVFPAGIGIAYLSHKYQRRSIIAYDSPATAIAPQDAALVYNGRREQSHLISQRTLEAHTKRGDAQLIDESNDLDTYTPGFEDDDEASWLQVSRNFNNVREGLSRVQWGSLGDKITDYVIPVWARHLPELIQKLQFEMSMDPGTLADDIWQEAHDPLINPEIQWDAQVRIGDDLCRNELDFRQKRKQYMVKAFAKYLNLDEDEVDPEDIPTIAMCGSGGGLRALVAGTSSYMSAQEAGLFDCVTYTAGVSGSCWLQSLFYSSVGQQNHKTLLKHITSRIGIHIAFPPPALKLVTSAPTSKFLLSGFVEKLKGDPGASFGLVDAYSLLLAARLMVPHGDLDVHPEDLKLSNQRAFIEHGQNPMPIYTSVRHEIPIEEEEKAQDKSNPELLENIVEKAKKEAWFQWFEMHPWEVGCEEIGAWIPTWSFGRPFKNGRNRVVDTGIALPEIRQSLLLGIWGSAFTATLAHYYKEIRPIVSGISGFGGLDGLLEDRNEDMVKIHPIEPATVPNWAYGMDGKLPSTCPDSILKNDHLQLMDAGMSNNLPIYPLLRPGRDVDVIIAFDASADIQKENWLSVVDGYAKQRGIKGWPVGSGWPKSSSKPEENLEALAQAQAATPQQASTKLDAAKVKIDEDQSSAKDDKQKPDKDKMEESPSTGEDRPNAESVLGPCNIWIGSKEERLSTEEPPSSLRVAWNNPEDSTFRLMQPTAGITVIYFPLLPNPKVEGVDPDKSDFLSTWNFIYTPEQVDKVVQLARTNFQEGNDATKRTIEAVYRRKKKLRIDRERDETIARWTKKLKQQGNDFI